MKTFIRTLRRNLRDLFLFNPENYYLEQYAKGLKQVIDGYKK